MIKGKERNEVQIENIENGRYGLFDQFLEFDIKDAEWKLIIDKRSALQIMTTLLDSENLLTRQANMLIEDLDEKIGEGAKIYGRRNQIPEDNI